MNRQEKQAVVESLKEKFSTSQASFVVNYKGLSVADLQRLRASLREQAGDFQVAKVRLVKRAIEDRDAMRELLPLLKDQLAFVFAQQEVPAVAKALHEFSKEKEALELLAGFFEQKVISKDQVTYLATLPPRDVLIAQLLGTMQAPTAKFTFLLNMMLVRLAVVLKKASESKS